MNSIILFCRPRALQVVSELQRILAPTETLVYFIYVFEPGEAWAISQRSLRTSETNHQAEIYFKFIPHTNYVKLILTKRYETGRNVSRNSI
jgi:hypothetical protein